MEYSSHRTEKWKLVFGKSDAKAIACIIASCESYTPMIQAFFRYLPMANEQAGELPTCPAQDHPSHLFRSLWKFNFQLISIAV